MGKAVFKTVLVAFESAARDVTVVATFVGSRAARAVAQGCRSSFLAATCSMVRVRQKLLEGAKRGAMSLNSIWVVTLLKTLRERLPPEDWADARTIRTRTRAVTYWAWIGRQLLKGHILAGVGGVLAMSRGYNPFVALYYYCKSLSRRLLNARSHIKGN